MELVKKAKEKVGEKAFDMIEKILGDIDLFDQLAEMIKTVLPCKLEATVKGKKALEINLHGIKDGQLWISVKRIREKKPAEKPLEEPAEVEMSEA